jgi:cytochrome c peroxidase
MWGCRPASQDIQGGPVFSSLEQARIQSLTSLPAPPPNPSNRWADDPRAASFGQKLFYDTRLSANGQFSCASCHHPRLGWSDGKARAAGLAQTHRNSPSLWNVAQQRWLFWDGRADSLWAQAIQPLENPAEMGMSRTALLHLFARHSDLRDGYQRLFGPLPNHEGLPAQARPGSTTTNETRAWQQIPPARQQEINRFAAQIGKALEAFERTIRSGESPFDRFARGLRTRDPQLQQALSIEARKGLRLFIGRGQCMLCHTGPLFSDREFHNLGLPPDAGLAPDGGREAGIPAVLADPFNGLGPYSDLTDREDVWNDKLIYLSRQRNNLGEFKTPGLREISRTGPYMHDGRFKTLREVLQFYSTLSPRPPAVGRREDTLQPLLLKPEEIEYLEAFLKALSGPEPELSQSGPPTPTQANARLSQGVQNN